MEGEWIGEGERLFPIADKRTRLETKTKSWVQGEFLVSRNQVKEIPLTGQDPEPREYVRLYWIRAKKDGAGQYELGAGTGDPARPRAHGKLEALVFKVSEVLGGEPPFKVESTTTFQEDGSGSEYIEYGTHGESLISDTQIRYQRKP